MAIKRCHYCNINKPLSEFYKHSCRSDGLSISCKDCAKSKSQLNIDLTNEEWKDIPGYEGIYAVSNKGRVKRLGHNKTFINRWGTYTTAFYREKPLKVVYNIHGYACISLKKKTFTIHSLVMSAFSQKPFHDAQVNHKDGNKKNNQIENLEWCTASENAKHKYSELGIKNGDEIAVKGTHKETGNTIYYASMAEAEKDGFQHSKISNCLSGKRKHHWGYIWEKNEIK